VLVTTFITNAIFNVWLPCIQKYASCLFNPFINIDHFFLLIMSRLLFILRSKLRRDSSLLKFIHHISIVILRWLRFAFLFQHIYLLFKSLDFKLYIIILFPYIFITRFYNNLLNIGMMALSTKSININIVAPFTTIASGCFCSLGCT
jgi:hypothetical protein